MMINKMPNKAFAAERKKRARWNAEVCQAWYRASEVKVLAPGKSGAEG